MLDVNDICKNTIFSPWRASQGLSYGAENG